MALIVSTSYSYLEDSLGSRGTFSIYFFFSVVFFIYFYTTVKEHRNLNELQIAALYTKHKKDL